MDETIEFETPMVQQYKKIKGSYPDCLLFFRLGDFYELFMDDAKIGASVLDIALTSRDRGKDGRIPMAGVPYHAVDSYLSKLVSAGYKVAICEQLSNPGEKDVVDRDVVRIVTPGTVMDEKTLASKSNNYIVSIAIDNNTIGLAFCDITTGSFLVNEHKNRHLEDIVYDEFSKLMPVECILPENLYNTPSLLQTLKTIKTLNVYPFFDWETYAENAPKYLSEHFAVKTLDSFGVADMTTGIKAASALLGYLKYTQKNTVEHIKTINTIENADYAGSDKSTISNLELFTTIKDKEKYGTLLETIDCTCTGFGGRLLRNWLIHPIKSTPILKDRYDAVEFFINNEKVRENTRDNLNMLVDIERLLARLSVGIGNARDLVNLKDSLTVALEIKENLEKQKLPLLISNLVHTISPEVAEIIKQITTKIIDEPAIDTKIGGLIKSNVNKDLDSLRNKVSESKNYIATIEQQEKERTGINSLKVRFNKVFGYYIEITNANLDMVPKDYMRKQTLVNAEGFITLEIKEHETIILTAAEKINTLEYEIFIETVQKVLCYTVQMQILAACFAQIDCLASFAELAVTNGYIRATITNTNVLDITEGRHPVVEHLISDAQFVPNDTYLDTSTTNLIILTGPNMSGKSVYIRQIAILTLMAQIGSFVPAKKFSFTPVDKIFVRSGASDVISRGLSTFMLEMVETANILNTATKESLIVMDEIGRGTSTYDGISIAWAISEYIINNIGAKTIFATHYHELQELAQKYPNKIKNYQVLAKEINGDPVFLHRVVEGSADHSFGIAVARLAGIPEKVTNNAQEILEELELHDFDRWLGLETKAKETEEAQENDVTRLFRETDINNLTPIEALNKLAEIKEALSKK